VWRLAEGATELAAEMCAREARGPGKVGHAERLAVAAVREVLGAEEMARGRDDEHR